MSITITIKPKKVKLKKCKICSEYFEPRSPFQLVDTAECAYEYSKIHLKRESKRLQDKNIKELKENLKTHKDYLNILQVVFNSYIRCRDANSNCICCDKPLKKGFHSGHFFSVGSHPALRFNEDNVHAQNIECNVFAHGNSFNYGEKLPLRIGQERFNKLLKIKNEQLKITIPEIKELIKTYKIKIAELKL